MGHHLTRQIGHPVEQVPCHAEETVKVGGVGELCATAFHPQLQVAPCIHHFHLMILDFTRLLSTVCHYQGSGRLLNLLHLQWTHTTTVYGPLDFVRDYPSELVPER